MKFKDSLPAKIALIGLLALLMLIPLSMVQKQIGDRQSAAYASEDEVASSWGRSQTLSGPFLKLSYDVEVQDGQKTSLKNETDRVYPGSLSYDVDIATQILHRSIYDVTVYRSEVVVEGDFVIPAAYAEKELTAQSVAMGLSDLRGIDGPVEITLGGRQYAFHSGSAGNGSGASLSEPVVLDPALMDGSTKVPFRLTYSVRGSSSLMVKPYGGTTEVREDGFDARWSVSEINRGKPDDTSFGVTLLQGVTQYQETMRSAKYGILIILLVFIAGLAVELVGKKKINPVQYLVIGLSLVLFYALVLSFSEFMNFTLAYCIAAVMTTGALFGYFRGILHDRSAWLLTALVALAYLLSYVLLQMKSYALITGTLVLFALLACVMFLTRNLNKVEE